MALRSTVTVVVALCTLVAPLTASAQARPAAGSTGPAPTLVLPQVQPPPRVSPGPLLAAASSSVEQPDHGLPALAPEVARARLKAFVTAAYGRGVQASASATDQAPPDEVLAQIDALSPEQVHDVDTRLGPVIWATRALSTRASAPTEPNGAAPAQSGDPEALRRDLEAYFARLEPYAPRAGGNAVVYTQLVTRMRQSVRSMTEEDLLAMTDFFNYLPSTRSVLNIDPAAILGGLPPGGGSQLGPADGLDAADPARLLAGSIHTNSACADMAFGPVAQAVLTNIANTANDIAGLLSDDYMATTFNIKEIPQLIAKSIALPLQLIALAAEADTTYFVNCNEGAHQVLFAEHDEEMKNRTTAMASLLVSPTLTSDLVRILDNRMDRLDTFNVESRRLNLRLAIEKDLLRHGDPRIALFQVPNDVCVTVGEHQSCGQLNTVRDIVADTVFDNRSAGFDTTLADTALQDGDSQRALGRYKAAYTRYRYAYQLAVRSGN